MKNDLIAERDMEAATKAKYLRKLNEKEAECKQANVLLAKMKARARGRRPMQSGRRSRHCEALRWGACFLCAGLFLRSLCVSSSSCPLRAVRRSRSHAAPTSISRPLATRQPQRPPLPPRARLAHALTTRRTAPNNNETPNRRERRRDRRASCPTIDRARRRRRSTPSSTTGRERDRRSARGSSRRNSARSSTSWLRGQLLPSGEGAQSSFDTSSLPGEIQHENAHQAEMRAQAEARRRRATCPLVKRAAAYAAAYGSILAPNGRSSGVFASGARRSHPREIKEPSHTSRH